MRITDIWISKKTPTISFELFPPRSEKQAENLDKAIEKLVALKPDFFSVTFGAGGSTREGSYQLVKKLKLEKEQEVLPYFACYGLGPVDIISVLDNYKDLGVENILAVRGDIPRDQENFKPHLQSLSHASDLIEFIRPRHEFCMGAAGYPEGHIEAESKEKDIEYLKLKVDNGVEFIICNYFYDNRYFFDFLDRCISAGISVPILPGVMPVYSVKMMEMLAGLCGATITDEIKQGIARLLPDDKDALNDFGIRFATEKCTELLNAGVPGLHIYTMDRSKSAVGLVNNLRKSGLL